jgi:hypothetical protein
MSRLGFVSFIFILVLCVIIISSCKKDSDTSEVNLLQNRWNHKSTNIYATDGSFHHVFTPSQPVFYDFNSNGSIIVTPAYGATLFYNLLSDDSTLIISGTDAFGSPVNDTNFITSLTDHDLVYHSFNPVRTINYVDSLTR